MGWSNATFQLLIVTASPSGFSGLFVYSPAPGTGNLIASITAASGTDPYGNAYLAGITSYHAGFNQYAQLFDSQLLLKSTLSAAIGKVNVSGLSPFVGWLNFTGANGYVFDNAIVAEGNVFAQNPSSPFGAEIWHTMTITATGFAAGSPAPRYRLEPDNTVRLSGVVNLTANQVSGADFFVFPAAYRPTASQFFVCANQLSGASATNSILSVDNTGNIGILVSGSTGNTIALDGVTYVLD